MVFPGIGSGSGNLLRTYNASPPREHSKTRLGRIQRILRGLVLLLTAIIIILLIVFAAKVGGSIVSVFHPIIHSILVLAMTVSFVSTRLIYKTKKRCIVVGVFIVVYTALLVDAFIDAIKFDSCVALSQREASVCSLVYSFLAIEILNLALLIAEAVITVKVRKEEEQMEEEMPGFV